MRVAIITIMVVLVLIGVSWAILRPADSNAPAGTSRGAPMVTVSLPEVFSPLQQTGAAAFTAHCADCHGTNGAGRDGIAPPLIHKIYEPSHHGDMSFQLAVKQGVRAHHWSFGDMPPVAGLASADVAPIIAYVRTVQRANGIN